MVADALHDQVDSLFDLTVGYSGLEKPDIPYEEYLMENVFFHGHYPKEVHIHVKKYDLQSLPGLNGAHTPAALPKVEAGTPNQFADTFDPESNQRRMLLSTWVKDRFMEKDAMIDQFYEKGSFEGSQHITSINPSLDDWLVVGTVCAMSWIIIPLWFSIFKFLLFALYHLIYSKSR
jgi:lysocardiolipin and lysophospholipid acyltransferase